MLILASILVQSGPARRSPTQRRRHRPAGRCRHRRQDHRCPTDRRPCLGPVLASQHRRLPSGCRESRLHCPTQSRVDRRRCHPTARPPAAAALVRRHRRDPFRRAPRLCHFPGRHRILIRLRRRHRSCCPRHCRLPPAGSSSRTATDLRARSDRLQPPRRRGSSLHGIAARAAPASRAALRRARPAAAATLQSRASRLPRALDRGAETRASSLRR